MSLKVFERQQLYPHPMSSSPSRMATRKSRVFVVDDHPLVREGLTNLINGQNDLIVCGEAKDSAQAIDGIAKARPDVALIDISLTNESGLELVKHMGRQAPQVALIVNIVCLHVFVIRRWRRRRRWEEVDRSDHTLSNAPLTAAIALNFVF